MPPSMLYSSVPPVAVTTMVPVVTVQVGCVSVGADTIGGVGTALMVTGLLLYAVLQHCNLCLGSLAERQLAPLPQCSHNAVQQAAVEPVCHAGIQLAACSWWCAVQQGSGCGV